MPRMKDMPSSGAFLRSSVHPVQVGLGSSPGRANSFANAPSKTPLRSTNTNHPTDLPVWSSFFSHRPATVGSAAWTGSATLLNATTLATSNSENGAFNGVSPRVRPTAIAQQYAHFRASRVRRHPFAGPRAGDFVAILPRSTTLRPDG